MAVVFNATAGQKRPGGQLVNVVISNGKGLGTTAADFDALAAAIIAITGDTYSSTTKQFTFGGATGLTHAQIAGLTGLNTVGADIVAAAAAGDVSITVNNAGNFTSKSHLRAVLLELVDQVANNSGLK